MTKRTLPKVERAVFMAIAEGGGITTVTALDRNPKVARHLGYGVEAIDVVSAMQARRLISHDVKSGEVKSGLSMAFQLVLAHIVREGGTTTVASLASEGDITRELGRGSYTEDLVYEMAYQGFFDYNQHNGEVKVF